MQKVHLSPRQCPTPWVIHGIMNTTPITGLFVLSMLAGAVVLVVALSWAMGAVGLLAGCVTGHRGLSAGIGGAVAVGGFLLESLAPLSTAIERFRWLSPFHYAMGGRALERGLRWADLAALVGLSLVLVAGSAWALERRDVEG